MSLFGQIAICQFVESFIHFLDQKFIFVEYQTMLISHNQPNMKNYTFGPTLIRQEVFGTDRDHDGVAECIFHLGRVARVAGNEELAQERFAESEAMYKRVFGEESNNAGLAEVAAKRRKRGKSREKKDIVQDDEGQVSEATPAEEDKEPPDLEEFVTQERRDSGDGPGPIE